MPVDVDSWRQPGGDCRYPPPSPNKLKHHPPDLRHFEALAEEEKQAEERSTMRKLSSSSSSSSSSMSSSLAASFSCSIDAATARHLVRIVLSLGLWLWYLVARAIVSTVLARLVPGSVKREKTYPVNGGGDPASELGEDRQSTTAQRSGGGGGSSSSSSSGGYSEHYSSSSNARLRLRHSLRKRKEQIILYGSPRALSPVSPASPASPASPVSPASPASYYSSSPSSSVPNSLSSSPDNSPALFYHRQIKQALLEHSNRIR